MDDDIQTYQEIMIRTVIRILENSNRVDKHIN